MMNTSTIICSLPLFLQCYKAELNDTLQKVNTLEQHLEKTQREHIEQQQQLEQRLEETKREQQRQLEQRIEDATKNRQDLLAQRLEANTKTQQSQLEQRIENATKIQQDHLAQRLEEITRTQQGQLEQRIEDATKNQQDLLTQRLEATTKSQQDHLEQRIGEAMIEQNEQTRLLEACLKKFYVDNTAEVYVALSPTIEVVCALREVKENYPLFAKVKRALENTEKVTKLPRPLPPCHTITTLTNCDSQTENSTQHTDR